MAVTGTRNAGHVPPDRTDVGNGTASGSLHPQRGPLVALVEANELNTGAESILVHRDADVAGSKMPFTNAPERRRRLAASRLGEGTPGPVATA